MRTLKFATVFCLLTAAPLAYGAEGPSTQSSPPASNPEQPYAPTSASATAPASTVAGQSAGAGAIPTLPLDVQTKNGISYITGGISDEEEAELKSKKADFNLHLLMSTPTGAYISNVMLRVLDNKDTELLSLNNAGPYFYAKFLPGTYTIEMTATQGGIKKVTVKIPENGAARDEHVTFME